MEGYLLKDTLRIVCFLKKSQRFEFSVVVVDEQTRFGLINKDST